MEIQEELGVIEEVEFDSAFTEEGFFNRIE